MPWIPVIGPADADENLRRIYQQIYSLYPGEYGECVPTLRRADGGEDSIVAAHSLIPDAMLHVMSTLGVLLQPSLPLTRRQHEMIAAVVSATNGCFY